MSEIVSAEIIDQAASSSTDRKSITISAMIQAALTLLSRVFGMIRDVMVSHIFGAGAMTDAYTVANTIPNVLRQFFGEGAFSVAFVPIYVATQEREGEHEAREFFRDAFGLLLLALVVITVGGIVFSGALVHAFAHGFATKHPEQLALAERMTAWLFPFILMIITPVTNC